MLSSVIKVDLLHMGVLRVLGNDLLSTHLIVRRLPTCTRKLIFRQFAVCQVLLTYTPSDPQVYVRY